MNFNFDWNCVSSGAPYVTISKATLAFNMPSASLLGNPEEIVIGFDESKLTIGIMDAKNMKNVKSYKFYSRIKNGWVRIGCKDFLKYLSEISNNNFSPAQKYVARFDSENQILYVTIKGKEDEANKEDFRETSE